MRTLFALLLLSLSLPTFAVRGDPEICDPLPTTAMPECPTGHSEVFYIRHDRFGLRNGDNPNDLCTRNPNVGEAASSWERICEPVEEAPHPQLLCREDKDDHSVNCHAAPVGAGLLNLWAADGVFIVADEQTNTTAIQTSFACQREGIGKVVLVVSKPSGYTSTVSSDIQCTGVYEGSDTDRQEPCEFCLPDSPYNPPEDK